MKCIYACFAACLLWEMMIFPLCGAGIIRDLKVSPSWPWKGLVEITYSVDGSLRNHGGTPAQVNLSFTGYDRDQNKNIELRTLTGDGAGKPVLAGSFCRTIWNAAADYPDFNSSAFQIKVSAAAGINLVDEPEFKNYLVINLSSGSSGTPYSYRFSSEEPDLAGDCCRTTEIWLRKIPAGSFLMGSPETELGREKDEDLHQVTLTQGFYIGIFEVTQKQWEQVTGNNPSYYKGADQPVEGVCYSMLRGKDTENGGGWPQDGYKVAPDSFFGILRARTGLMLDLPTEAQWEYACRAGTLSSLNSGKNITVGTSGCCPNLEEVGRYYMNINQNFGNYIYHCRVGSYMPNRWGLYDMHGNVNEWCLDRYWFYKIDDPVDPVGASAGSMGVLRGGNWACDNPAYFRSAYRIKADFGKKTMQCGFRLVFDLKHRISLEK